MAVVVNSRVPAGCHPAKAPRFNLRRSRLGGFRVLGRFSLDGTVRRRRRPGSGEAGSADRARMQ